MERHHPAARPARPPVRYLFVVRRELRAGPTTVLPGLSLRSAGGYSELLGDVVDQRQLMEVIDWFGSRGVEIASFGPVAPAPGDTAADLPR